MCKSNGELVDHLPLHCAIAREFWSCVLFLFGIQCLMPRKVLNLYFCRKGMS
jgi:hypothetical protein